mgnify:CR=1 FL=1
MPKEYTNEEKYAIIKEKMAKFKKEEELIKGLIINEMKSNGDSKRSTENGNFTLSIRKTKKPFGEELELAEDNFKKAKDKAIEKGNFEVTESEVLTFKSN